MPATDVTELLGFDTLLSEEERLIQDTVRSFVNDKIKPYIAEWFEQGISPRELATELGDLGLLGMHLHGYGCAGTSAVAYGLACLELEAGDSGLRSFVSVQGSLSMFSIWKYGSEEQKQQWLPDLASGAAIGGFLVPKGTPGFTTTDVHHKLSLRASTTSALNLDDVRLPAGAILPGARG